MGVNNCLNPSGMTRTEAILAGSPIPKPSPGLDFDEDNLCAPGFLTHFAFAFHWLALHSPSAPWGVATWQRRPGGRSCWRPGGRSGHCGYCYFNNVMASLFHSYQGLEPVQRPGAGPCRGQLVLWLLFSVRSVECWRAVADRVSRVPDPPEDDALRLHRQPRGALWPLPWIQYCLFLWDHFLVQHCIM